MAKKANKIEKMKRIYIVSLLLRRKPISYIIQYAAENWKIEERQTREYIRLAREEWKKYFDKVKGDGMSYHVTQLRDLKDKALDREIIIGRGINQRVVNVADLNLAFEIAKEEGKLMDIYPTEKKKIEIEGSLDVNSELDKKLAQLDIKDLKKLVKPNIKANAIKQ